MPEAAPVLPVLPAYGGACVSDVVPAILQRRSAPRPWLPEAVAGAAQVVLLVLDGLGWEQLQERPDVAPTLSSMTGGPVSTVAPSTTATALTSLTTGVAPSVHGVLGYRVQVMSGEPPAGQVLNVLRWTTGGEDARAAVPPEAFQRVEPFGGTKPPVVTRAEFHDSGFSRVHLSGSQLHGWRYPSTLRVRVGALLAEGHDFVYAYYAGVDTVAHEFGFGDFYDAELAAADRLVADLLGVLPAGAALAVVSDHGQVEVGDRLIRLAPPVLELTALLSGEGRFRWLHAVPGMADRLADATREHHDDVAWVRTFGEAEAAGWFGGPIPPETRGRLGDVVLAAREPVALVDPADTGDMRLICRHGSLTAAEMLVPLVAARG